MGLNDDDCDNSGSIDQVLFHLDNINININDNNNNGKKEAKDNNDNGLIYDKIEQIVLNSHYLLL